MAYEARPNTGGLFRNTKREKDSQPTMTGHALVLCPHCQHQQAYWLDGWTKTRGEADRWFSLAFKPKITRKVPAIEKPRSAMPDDKDYPF